MNRHPGGVSADSHHLNAIRAVARGDWSDQQTAVSQAGSTGLSGGDLRPDGHRTGRAAPGATPRRSESRRTSGDDQPVERADRSDADLSGRPGGGRAEGLAVGRRHVRRCRHGRVSRPGRAGSASAVRSAGGASAWSSSPGCCPCRSTSTRSSRCVRGTTPGCRTRPARSGRSRRSVPSRSASPATPPGTRSRPGTFAAELGGRRAGRLARADPAVSHSPPPGAPDARPGGGRAGGAGAGGAQGRPVGSQSRAQRTQPSRVRRSRPVRHARPADRSTRARPPTGRASRSGKSTGRGTRRIADRSTRATRAARPVASERGPRTGRARYSDWTRNAADRSGGT